MSMCIVHVHVHARRLLVANLGDSRCALVRSDGSAVALSDDHKPNRPDEKARVQAATYVMHVYAYVMHM